MTNVGEKLILTRVDTRDSVEIPILCACGGGSACLRECVCAYVRTFV